MSLKLIYSYLKERIQRTKIGTSFSSWKNLLLEFYKDILFNIFLCDLFLLINGVDIDDNKPYIAGNKIDQAISALKNAATSLFKWFSDNQIKANPDKNHLLINKS